MSDAVRRFAQRPAPPPDDARSLATMQREAAAAGATLANEGKGGLPSQAVLGAMRKAKFHCQICGRQENLSVHHKAHLAKPSARMARLWKKLPHADERGLAVACTDCHDRLHSRDRKGAFDGAGGEPAPALPADES